MGHEPIQFGRRPDPEPRPDAATPGDARPRPRHLDLQKDRALTITWDDGRVSIYPILYLRRMSPSADAKALREEMARNPLAVLPASGGGASAGLTATGAELVGNYAVRIAFSDGHDTGIYSWAYLRSIDPNRPGGPGTPATADAEVRP